MLRSKDFDLPHSDDSDNEVISFLAPPTSLHHSNKMSVSFLESSIHPMVSSAHFMNEPSGSDGAIPLGDLGEAAQTLPPVTPTTQGPLTDDPPPLPIGLEAKTILQSNLETLFTVDATSYETSGKSTLPICMYLLRNYFQIPTASFRPRQQEVCLSVLQGRHTLAVCPTGWGKSLCYQFPMLVHRLLFNSRYDEWERQQRQRENEALPSERVVNSSPPPWLHSKFCIVVSPLLSLMGDQAASIRGRGCLQAFVLSSNVSAAAEADFFKKIASPVSTCDVVFVSPEKLISSVPLRMMLKAQKHRLAMICVDEAHCVSRWAYDFRPSFLYLNRILSEVLAEGGMMGETADSASCATPVAVSSTAYLCLTATAARPVVGDLQSMFTISHTVVCTDQFRENLILESVDLVRLHSQAYGLNLESEHARGPPTTRTLQAALVDAVKELPKPLIVYVQSRVDADELTTQLASKLGAIAGNDSGSAAESRASRQVFSNAKKCARPGLNGEAEAIGGRLVVRSYHAGLSTHLRTTTQREFINDHIDVLIATVAFGMGIDKHNVRSVLHAYAPSSLESYVQEIGRAGRDGQASYCRVLYNPHDFYTLRARLWTSLLSPQEFYAIVLAILSNPITQFGEKIMLVPVQKISQQLSIAEETVETVLFMLLAHQDPLLRNAFRGMRGSCPLGYRVSHATRAKAEAAHESSALSGWSPSMAAASRKRLRKGGKASSSVGGNGAVMHLLAQLQADDPVADVFNRHEVVANQVEAANEARLGWDEFTYRCADLIENEKMFTLSRLSSAYVIELGPKFADIISPAGIKRVSWLLFAEYDSRLASQVESLRRLFAILQQPTHEAIFRALEEDLVHDKIVNATMGEPGLGTLPPWKPPACSHTRVEAVSIANSFVAENLSRISSTYEAARCLLGVMPKSLIKHGKYAGQIPLSHSWYVRCPYFGRLREFDLRWILAVLAPHNLDKEAKT